MVQMKRGGHIHSGIKLYRKQPYWCSSVKTGKGDQIWLQAGPRVHLLSFSVLIECWTPKLHEETAA